MTAEEAISVIEKMSKIQNEHFIAVIMGTWYKEMAVDFHDALTMAVDALKKQIPVKPVQSKEPRYGMGYDYYDWICPVCNSFLAFECQRDNLPQICRCGQAIDWLEDE